jgi:hypothetical protein
MNRLELVCRPDRIYTQNEIDAIVKKYSIAERCQPLDFQEVGDFQDRWAIMNKDEKKAYLDAELDAYQARLIGPNFFQMTDARWAIMNKDEKKAYLDAELDAYQARLIGPRPVVKPKELIFRGEVVKHTMTVASASGTRVYRKMPRFVCKNHRDL